MGVKSEVSSNLDKTCYVGLCLDPNKIKRPNVVWGASSVLFSPPRRGQGGHTGVIWGSNLSFHLIWIKLGM